MATATRHEELSRRFLRHAQEEFEKGDMLQASEKAWGAVAHLIKSVARAQGWRNGSHRDVFDNGSRLCRLTADPQLNIIRMSAVNQLHVNFYEEELRPEDVKTHLQAAEELIIDLREAAEGLPA